MAKADQGNTVKIHYKGTLDDGSEFDSSEGRDPLEFTIGQGQVIPGFEKGVMGMEVNEKKSINIPAIEAYGERREDLVATLPKSELPDNIDPEIGQQLQIQNENGQTFLVTISEIEGESITLDANHPLSGQNLNFDIELVEIVS